MKRKVLVIGRLSQLGSILNAQIIAALQTAKLITEGSQVTFLATNLSQPVLAKKAKELGVTDVVYVGIKGHVITTYIELIDRAMTSPMNHLLVCTEGQIPKFEEKLNIEVFTTLEELSQQDFSKKIAA